MRQPPKPNYSNERLCPDHFCKVPRTGAVKSRGVTIYVFFAPGVEADEVVCWVGRDFLFFEQAGATLGQRMKHAFERTFVDGARRSVIIGTDVPEISHPF